MGSSSAIKSNRKGNRLKLNSRRVNRQSGALHQHQAGRPPVSAPVPVGGPVTHGSPNSGKQGKERGKGCMGTWRFRYDLRVCVFALLWLLTSFAGIDWKATAQGSAMQQTAEQ